MNARSLPIRHLSIVSPPKETTMPLKTTDDMIRELYESQADPERRPVNASDFRVLNDRIHNNELAARARHTAHEQKDEQAFKDLGGSIAVVQQAVLATVKRVDKLEDRRTASPYPGAYSLAPGALNPSATGSVKIEQVWEALEGMEKKIQEEREAKDSERQAKDLAQARLQGAEEARQKQVDDAAKASQERDKAEDRRVRRVTIFLAVLGICGSAVGWLANEARHTAVPSAVSAPVR